MADEIFKAVKKIIKLRKDTLKLEKMERQADKEHHKSRSDYAKQTEKVAQTILKNNKKDNNEPGNG